MIHKQNERKLISLVKSGVFEIDKQGRIWRVKVALGTLVGRRRSLIPIKRRRAERILNGLYYHIAASIDGITYAIPSHRLVWQYFRGDIPQGLVINHLNGIKIDNRPCNLEVVTYGDNQRHAFRTGLKHQNGEINPGARITNESAKQIRTLYATKEYTQEDLATLFCVSRTAISNVVRGISYGIVGGEISLANRRDANPKNATSVIAMKPRGRIIKDFDSMGEAAAWAGTNYSNISACCRGKRKRAGGYEWEYRGDQFRIKNPPQEFEAPTEHPAAAD